MQCTRYKRNPYVARTALRTKSIKKPVINSIRKLVSHECVRLCKKKNIIFRMNAIGRPLVKFKILIKELRRQAPLLFSIAKSASTGTKSKKKPNLNAAAMAAAVLLKERNKTMCSPQSIVSVLLYAGHCSNGMYHE